MFVAKQILLSLTLSVLCLQEVMSERPPFPAHWGSPPMRQTRDLVDLPAPFGRGSSTLKGWISEKMQIDATSGKYEKGVNGDAVPTPKREWPELVGMEASKAKEIVEAEGHGLNSVLIVPDGHMVTMDFREDRVRIFADADQNVVHAPRTG
eukprot:m.106481 g.106481  ORF g.106481 m.106481 type:complete len:151 (+) comp27725_c0_seq2:211-663(+)